MKNYLFILNGGIAIYKVIDVIRHQIKNGNKVRVVMTEMAKHFITPLTFQTLTNEDVFSNFEDNVEDPVAHVSLADWADVIVVAPATANFIAKMANGIGDDFASTIVLARHSPVYVIPAMNSHMWSNFATKRNVKQLRDDGIYVLEPDDGLLAEGYTGKGRFPEIDQINQFLDSEKQVAKDLENFKIVVTAGGTREPIDPVRFIGNFSSGKMGYAIANEAAQRGAKVILITGPTNLKVPTQVISESIETVRDLQESLNKAVTDADVVIMAAAVSDYRPLEKAQHKLKKENFDGNLEIKLVENPDVIANMKRPDTLKMVVGFAAETDDLLDHASTKLAKKRLDMIVANDVSGNGIGFGADDNAVTLLQPDKDKIVLKKQIKNSIAREILNVVAEKIMK
ncbi:bifunctional phosphopantothenoylcysteine decarboxylase/phosphopantothenate--cysteine ligase CoaBC [Pediococcus claussenii]|uniref:Coenzyme A biosynthesis bifunctional protein CoaBC n=1 Tax=Pediococcus claussenii (strain ATCC BAA-344 / DSM 14800 / JCM 18046 / KCTC 3811 / LMG 21948 / P06) TaxID=701521 RepID=G8PDI6_PEDCP|nr:bifunctional phosphopantothenoylcysteine decarboxylase/phosphopantothenate--cysteine ligase CoaBC [Pediococcus claussenii]AEV95321.1 phosphopantothenoylcysteine decarboxylase/phosphopantothenate--cysteine ligase [Pediococcus claussenii ATCC BAA-344]ANZ68854.1 DNA/pantothenate metabolism flavoprotein [Pediococcus claussenii]ANZ70670.1 DNA/pantothenate metabolism flavoprotein [Pediococcus claussenii]KRN19497.1 coaBC protein [Pediococcus claussenii]